MDIHRRLFAFSRSSTRNVRGAPTSTLQFVIQPTPPLTVLSDFLIVAGFVMVLLCYFADDFVKRPLMLHFPVKPRRKARFQVHGTASIGNAVNWYPRCSYEMQLRFLICSHKVIIGGSSVWQIRCPRDAPSSRSPDSRSTLGYSPLGHLHVCLC